jgi:hypothetical protein
MAEVPVRHRTLAALAVTLAGCLAWGCAGLAQMRGVVQPPQFSQSDDKPAELRVLRPGTDLPSGGAGVRLWTRVSNPNPFGFTLGTVRGTLFLEGARGATADFPLGLPLRAGEEVEVPLDLTISFADLPGLAGVLRDAALARPVAYRLDGTVGVDAGRLGQPVFGPMTLLTGEARVR